MTNTQQEYLKSLLAPLGFADKLKNFCDFLDFLAEKNQELNVISRKLPIETIILEHLYDCIGGFEYFKPFSVITDLGSGGGFPGLLLGIAFPDKIVNLVEKSPKKTAYLNEAVKTLGLKNVRVHSCLVNDFHEKTDVFTCRAFKSTEQIIQMTMPYFKKGTPYLLFKGRKETIDMELSQIKGLKYITKLEKICPEIKDKERYLLFLQNQN
ncbi:MAG: 16S rRNA (guanine(527)-N(7))-methyltransferase RsmG [Spirochaetales bacterium]|nr:16S rRNA (guanine(527)-N(7))-methyltransferase RsmG [Spirochaetales bacterium]